MPEIMPIMLELCLMLLLTYYAKNYAGIIDSSLLSVVLCINYFVDYVLSHSSSSYIQIILILKGST